MAPTVQIHAHEEPAFALFADFKAGAGLAVVESDPAAEEAGREAGFGVRVHHLGVGRGLEGEFVEPEGVEEVFGSVETVVIVGGGRWGRGGRGGGEDDGGDVGFEYIGDEFGVRGWARGLVLRGFGFGLDEREGFRGDDDARREACDEPPGTG